MIDQRLPVLYPNPLMRFPKDRLCMCGSGKRFKLCHRPQLPVMVTRPMAEAARAMLAKLIPNLSPATPAEDNQEQRTELMAKDLSKIDQAASELYDQGFQDGVASVPPSQPAQSSGGVSADQEASDIAAAVKPLQDQIAALQADDQAKADLAASLQATVDKIKALLA